ncbi:MAG: hypothetical protein HWN81_18620 [Candidatus Lokiarchaeota archaeon]|nr:hypothetical protein [Candidatus Lokiarchaeota archaeon]
MKRKVVFLNFTLLFLLICSIISNVDATKYSMGVQNNQELIWKCNVCNQIEMDNIFGNDWDDSGIFENLSKGKRMKWRIGNIEVDETFIKLNFSMWRWTSRNIWGVKDKDSQIIFFSNPNDYTKDLYFSSYSSLVPFWFPVPVGEYMGGLKLNKWYDVDNRVLPTLNVEIEKDTILPGFPSKDIKIIAIYDDQGILNSYKLYTKGNVVIIEISFYSLPPYVIPTLIGLTIGLSLSIILYIFKKRRSESVSL